MRRVVITGIGLVTPLGLQAPRVWDRLIRGESGLRKIDLCDVSDLTSQVGGQVPRTTEPNGILQGALTYDDWIEPKERRKMGDYIVHGIVASDLALQDAGWAPKDEESLSRTGVMIGAGIGGLEGIYETSVTLYEKGPRRVSPFFIPSCLINLVSGHVSIRHGFRGPNHSVVTACATGAHAIGDAARLIQWGDADVMVAGGTESALCRIAISGFSSARALSTSYNDRPTEASRPWDQGRDGFVMGEGAGIVVLEELNHALKRGAKIYGEIAGYGLSGDAHHITSPLENGAGGAAAIRMALNRAGMSPTDIDYINAHGTSTPAGDIAEIRAIRDVFKDHPVSISSTKSAIGHLLGAAGSVEAIFCLMALQDQIVPPTLNLHHPDPATVGMDLVPLVAKERKIRTTLSNSFGFGGTNACLIFKKFDGCQ